MATSTNIQYLLASGKDELGATVQVGPGTSNRRQIETFISGGAIISGDWVAVDPSQTGATKMLTITQAGAVVTGNALVVGVALEAAAAAGSPVDVCISGYCAVANVANAVGAAGVPLSVLGVPGRAVAATNADVSDACGVSLSAAIANVADVFVYKRF